MGAMPSKASAPGTPPPLPPPLPPEAMSCSSLWSDIPPELAGLVLRRFPSLADRVRFASVCRQWRHAAQQQAPVLPPVLPWTIGLHTRIAQIFPDGELHSLRSGKFAFISCTSENWLLMIGRRESLADTKTGYFLQNPLSGATLPLPFLHTLQHHHGDEVTKFIVRPDNLVVAILGRSIPHRGPLVVCCRPGWSSWSTTSQAGDRSCCYEDICFHGRGIYAITERGDLFAHEVNSEEHGHDGVLLSSGKLVINGGDDTSCFGGRQFLVASCHGGGLLMVNWKNGFDTNDDYVFTFEVFEADLHMSRWSRLSSLGDQVLFVSLRCSKAIPVVSGQYDDYLLGNRIYFVDFAAYGPKECHIGNYTSCGMYDLGDNTYHPIVSDKSLVNPATWFFPHE